MADLGVNTSAGETAVLWGEGDVSRTCEAGLYSSETPSPVVSTFVDGGALVRELGLVVSSVCTWFLFVVTVTSVESRGAIISGLVGKNRFPAVVRSVVGPAIRVSGLDEGLGVGPAG